MADTPRTDADLRNNIFPDNQAAGSITAQDMRDLTASVAYLSKNGWQFFLDGQYTSGDPGTLSGDAGKPPLQVAGGVRTPLTIDGTFGLFGDPPGSEIAFPAWDVNTNKILPGALNSFGFARIAIVAFSTAGATNLFDLELDVGTGDFPVIYHETVVFAKGQGLANHMHFNFSIPLFVGPDFLANGGQLFITPENDAEFFQAAITAVQTYTPYDPTPVV